MSKRARRHVVNTQRCDTLQSIDINIARAFRFSTTVDKRKSLFHLLSAHVVKHDDVGPRFQCLGNLLQRFAFHFNLANERCARTSSFNGICYAAGSIQVIVFQHHAIGKIEAVVSATA